jgi:hypothetical protein
LLLWGVELLLTNRVECEVDLNNLVR